MTLDEGTQFMVMAPVVRGRKGEYGKLLEQIRLEGYSRVRVDGELRRLDEEIVLDKKFNHDISVVVDRLVMKTDLRRRLSESVEAAAGLAAGVVEVECWRRASTARRGARAVRERRRREGSEGRPGSCLRGSRTASPSASASPVSTAAPRSPSWSRGSSPSTRPTAPASAAHGLGFQRVIDPELVVPDPTLALAEGALQPWNRGISAYWKRLIAAVAEEYGVDAEVPWSELTKKEKEIFLYGTGEERHQVTYTNRFGRRRSYKVRFEGIVNNLERRYGETDSDGVRERVEGYMAEQPCPRSAGARDCVRRASRSRSAGSRIHAAHRRCRRGSGLLRDPGVGNHRHRSGRSPGYSSARSPSDSPFSTTSVSGT